MTLPALLVICLREKNSDPEGGTPQRIAGWNIPGIHRRGENSLALCNTGTVKI